MPLGKKKGGASKKGGSATDDIVPLDTWAVAQKAAFTAWMNSQLKHSGVHVKDLFSDLEDGVILIKLMEVLSGKKMHGKFHSKPSRAVHRNQNLSTVFAFMIDVEHLPIVNITPNHILEHEYKQILTLIWHLIVHYHISETSKGSKTLLLDWFSTTLPDKEIFNFTTSWRDGRNLSALVNYCNPTLIPDHDSLDPNKARENLKNAMKLAEDKLGIPHILSPEDVTSDHPDERSMMVYLAYFIRDGSPGQKRLLQWLHEQVPGQKLSDLSSSWVDGIALGALTHALSGGGFPTYEEFKSESALENCKRAMEAAESLLGVDLTLKPEEFADPNLNVIIRSTYLTQFLYSTSHPKVVHMHTPGAAGTSSTAYIDIVCPEGITGEVEAYAKSSTAGKTQAAVESTGDNQYRISFTTENPEIYTLTVCVGDKRVKGSPFSFNLTPPDPNAVKHVNTILPKKAGIPALLLFDLAEAGKGTLTSNVTGETSGDVLNSAEQMSPTSCKVSFFPWENDVYNVAVNFNGEPVRGSPFVVTINNLLQPERATVGRPQATEPGERVTIPIDVSKADPRKVKLTKPPTGVLDPGQLITISFDTSKAGKGELKATCSGKKTGELEVELKEVSKGNHEVSFIPPSMDDYSLEVTWGGGHVTGSPFTLNLVPRDHPNPKNVKVVGFPLPKDILVVDEEISFQVDTKDAGKGVLHVSVENEATHKKSNGQLVKDEKSDGGEGEGEVAKEGESGGHEEKQGENVEEEGSDAVATPPAPPPPPPPPLPQEEKQPNEEEKPAPPPEPDQQQEAAAASMPTSPSGLTSPVPSEPVIEQSKDNPKIFHVSYKPTISGRHTINILWAGEPLPSFPKEVNVVQPRIAQFGAPIKIELKTNYKRKHLKVQAVPWKGGKEHKVRMDKIASGHYVLIFQPAQPGVYLLHVATKERKLEDSPYVIRYTESVKPEVVKVSGLEGQGYVGEPIIFTIDAKEAGSGEVSVYRQSMGSVLSLDSTLTQEGDVISLHVKRNDDGTFSAVYTPTVPGEESLDVRFGGIPIPGSPFPVSVLKKEGGATTLVPEVPRSASVSSKKKGKAAGITGFGLENERFLVGNTQKFKLHCEELGEGTLEVTSKPHSAAEIDITTTTGENSYWVEITPKKAGKHDIIVRYGGKHISGSPFRVQFLSRGDALKCSMVDPLADCPTEIENEVIFCISTKGAGKGKLRAAAKSIPAEREVPVTVSQAQKHHYHVQFPPMEGLNYMLSVFYDEVHIQGSPFRIALGDASRCRATGTGLVKAWSKKWNKFTIDSEEAGPGELGIVIEGEGLGGLDGENSSVEPNISKLDEFHYEVAYEPLEVGNYWITVKWGNIEIPCSPFCVPCRRPLDQSQFAIEEIVTQTFLGKPAQIIINCNEPIEEEDKLTVSVHSAQDERHQGQVARNSVHGDQSYACTITPPSLGTYQVYVLWDEKHIPESPFSIENIPVPCSDRFRIEAAEAEQQVIAMKVHGPRYAFRYVDLVASIRNTSTGSESPVSITRNSYEESLVQFRPAHGEGEHVVKITYDDQDIQGSPFTLISTDASQCYAKGKGIHKAVANKWNKFSVFTENGGPGELRVEIEGKVENGDEITLEPLVTASTETRYDVSYSPNVAGKYKISVFWDVHQIPGSPFNIYCCDPQRYTLHNPPKEGTLGKPLKVAIKVSTSQPSDETLEIFSASKEHEKQKGEVGKGSDGSTIASVQPTALGKYLIHVQCNGFEVEGSPFKTRILPPPVAEKVVASGPGLSDGKVSCPSNFTIDVSEAGHGYVSFQVQGPKNGFKINLQRDPKNKDIIKGEYNPTHPGTYIVALLWSGVHIPNSPFTVKVDEQDPEILTYEPEEQARQENE